MSWLPKEFVALQEAAEAGDLQQVRALLDGGVDPNTHPGMPKGWSPLMSAAQNGHLDVVRELVERGASVAFSCGDNFTALSVAATPGHWDVVKYLAGHGANVDDPNVFDNAGGWTTAVLLAERSGKPDLAREIREAAGLAPG